LNKLPRKSLHVLPITTELLPPHNAPSKWKPLSELLQLLTPVNNPLNKSRCKSMDLLPITIEPLLPQSNDVKRKGGDPLLSDAYAAMEEAVAFESPRADAILAELSNAVKIASPAPRVANVLHPT
jgi:hypothetical protein